MESWQSGLSRLFAKQVNQKVTGVRIPCFPQSCINRGGSLQNHAAVDGDDMAVHDVGSPE